MKSILKLVLALLLIVTFGCDTKNKNSKSTENLYNYNVEARLDSLGITLSEPAFPKGIKIVLVTRVNNVLYLYGNGPIALDGIRITEKVGTDLTVE